MSRRVEDLQAPLQPSCRQLLADAQSQGMDLVIVHTLRTFEEQALTYAKGRTRPGEPCTHAKVQRPVGTCADHPLGATVTKAKPGQSWHNFGLALDVAFRTPGGGVTWSGPWKRLGDLGKGLGLEWGGDWTSIVDKPHFQLTGGLSLAEAKARWPQGWQGAG